jgi:hypothetical protein
VTQLFIGTIKQHYYNKIANYAAGEAKNKDTLAKKKKKKEAFKQRMRMGRMQHHLSRERETYASRFAEKIMQDNQDPTAKTHPCPPQSPNLWEGDWLTDLSMPAPVKVALQRCSCRHQR